MGGEESFHIPLGLVVRCLALGILVSTHVSASMPQEKSCHREQTDGLRESFMIAESTGTSKVV